MTPRSDFEFDAGLAPDEIIVDSFAGGGGASLGIQWALGRSPDIAINHDKEAIALHRANHPESQHYPEDVWHVDPVEACRGRRVGLMWLSPDCKHFSKAKGGKPVNKKIRGLAWTAVRWAKAVRPRVIVLENVEEFQTWGPVLYGTNKPCPKRKGQTFRAFVRKLERLGYAVEWRELRACDYGAPTIRKRLFLVARCDGAPIVWPQPTHGKDSPAPWRTAAECIEWSIACPSIFERKRALADNTLRRIARGIQRYVIDSPRPFIVQYHSAKRPGDDRVGSIDGPLGTQTVENRFGLVAPVIAGVGGRAGQSPERSLAQPYQTVTAKADAAIVVPHLTKFHSGSTGSLLDSPMPTVTSNSFNKRPGGSVPLGLVSPLLVPTTHDGDARAHAIDEPMRTVTGAHRGEHALVSGFLKPRYGEREGQAPRVRSLEDPMPVIVPTGNGGDLVSTYLAKHNGGNEATGQSFEEPVHTITARENKALVTAHIQRDFGQSVGSDAAAPLPTITGGANGHAALVASHLTKFYGTTRAGAQLELPMPTITANDRGGGHIAEVRAFLISYYSAGQNTRSVRVPAPTVTPKDRIGLVTVEGVEYQIADIGMRMLAPRELYRAQGFPDSYRIEVEYNGKPLTKTAQVRMCGNSVCPPQAAAIIRANFGASVTKERAA